MKMKYLVSILHYLLSHFMITDCFIDYSGLLHHALNEGYVVKWTKLTLCGPPGSGKLSDMKVLLYEPPPYTHYSTPVTTPREVRKVDITSMITVGDDQSIQSWNKVDFVSLMVAQTMKVGLKTQTILTEEEIETLEDEHVDQDIIDKGNCDTSTVTMFTKDDSQPNETPLSFPAIWEVAQLSPTLQKSSSLYETHWIYCVDSGGQVAFLDIAPALLHYNLVNILTLKLNKKLNDKPKFFSVKGELLVN